MTSGRSLSLGAFSRLKSTQFIHTTVYSHDSDEEAETHFSDLFVFLAIFFATFWPLLTADIVNIGLLQFNFWEAELSLGSVAYFQVHG